VLSGVGQNVCKYMSVQMYINYVFTPKDKDRSVSLHASIPPAMPGPPDHYHAPVLQRQSPHRAVMHVTEAACALFQG